MNKEFFSQLTKPLLGLLVLAMVTGVLIVTFTRFYAFLQEDDRRDIERSEAKARVLFKKYDIEVLACDGWDTCTVILTREGKLYKVNTMNGRVYGWTLLE